MLSKKAHRGQSIVYNCQQTKDFVNGIIEEYLCFAALCLDDEDYVRNIHSLLPFDNLMQARLRLDKYATPVRSLGLSVMRMDFSPRPFALGISINIAEGEANQAIDTTILISAGRSLHELRQHVRTDNFTKLVTDNFEKQIDISYKKS